MNIQIPELSLVVLVGASGAGKSTFARRHFLPTEVLSSDACRGLVADDENDQAATTDAFAVLHFIARTRLAAGRLTVVDATNVQPESRKPLVALAREQHVLPVAIVFNLPERLAHERNAARPDRAFGPHVVRRQTEQLRRHLSRLHREGFQQVYTFTAPAQVETATVERTRLWTNRKDEHGPFDIIGDVHGCYDELAALLDRLGYTLAPTADGPGVRVLPPEGRRAIFLGDLVDRGPKTPDVLRLVMGMAAAGTAICVPGNHESKLLRKLQGRNVQVTHGLGETLAQLAAEPPEFAAQVATFLDGLISHAVLDDGKLVVAHAGMKQALQGRASARVRDFALYGETTGETDEFGLPVRYNWAAEYRGPATVVYGHTPVPEPAWLNRTICVDTGCVFGGKLTALRYPENELVAVPAARVYYEPAHPFPANAASTDESPLAQHWERRLGGEGQIRDDHADDLPNLDDVLGKRLITTRLQGNITIREENALAALEVMSRYAVDPRWLIHLPPTMSPTETSREPDLLEHPAAAFAYYRHAGVPTVVCEEKHMGSRAVVIACRDATVARRRFGVESEAAGVVYTRTGRAFFNDAVQERALLDRVRAGMDTAGLWQRLDTDWICLDGELLPWSAKAQELLSRQYAAAGAAARAGFGATEAALTAAAAQGVDVAALQDRYAERQQAAAAFVAAYGRYCWPVDALADLKLAPFHILATEGAVHVDQDHRWHMETIRALCEADAGAGDAPVLMATPYRLVDLTDPVSEAGAVQWWTELTEAGGEGMVVKPLSFIARGQRGLLQPAVKCRGREYLRIVYGPEYTLPDQLERLRARGLGLKRSLALREFALGIEALERFVRREPLYRVHECAFGVLALESEPVDPRL